MAGLGRAWLVCIAAMALGLWVDARHTPAALLANECGAPGGLLDMAWRHASLMPASSAAMFLAAIAPWHGERASPPGPRLLCAVLMTIGMVLGARLGAMAALATGTAPFAAMVAGMAFGMALGMALPTALAAAAALASDAPAKRP